jgi:D-serine deaminase-like pyridoxal phosphate-dependent protein
MVNNVDNLRPHVKTNKIAEVCKMMMDAGIYKFKCATIAEAEMLGMLGAQDVLLAYQPVGPKINRLLALVKKYPSTHFACLVDNITNAKNIAAIFTEGSAQADIYIDVNTGMDRSGIKPDGAFELFGELQRITSLQVLGLHGYDGHIRDTDLTERQDKSDTAFNRLSGLKQHIALAYGVSLALVTSGSITFPTHAQRENLECSPGTFVFWDWGYKNIAPDEPFELAALVITRIISIVDNETITTDLGHKSLAAENPMPRVYFLNAPDAKPISQSEEHLVAKVPDASIYTVGDVLYGAPIHICPTVALYERAVVIESNKAVGEWKVIARDRKIMV